MFVMHRGIRALSLAAAGVLILLLTAQSASATDVAQLTKSIRGLSPDVFAAEAQSAARRAVGEQLRARLQKANDESRRQWLKIKTPQQWQAFRAQRIAALKASLGDWPEPPKSVRTKVTGTVEGDGFTIDNIVFESRPGWSVTANLYRPAKPTGSMPGIIISHAHHRPKEHSELQDMGMTWARAGCLVLVPDHLGHGERGQHGFTKSGDFPREFAVSRQDYYFRYDNSIQLYLAGESLMGWMAWDLMRGVDVLLQQEGIDKDKIILLGAVAGGGDPCAVTAALDERIACAVPFNFGGPQPETRYPLPEDAETSFNYAGSGSWESTRNLAYSAAGDSRFLPWEIVAGIAPRRLIFAHEFSWDRERDPVWKRLEAVYELQGVHDHLAYTHGRGELKGRPPEATHCTHIGKFHRQRIHQAFAKWFDIHAKEFSDNRSAADLHAGTAEAVDELHPRSLHAILADSTAAALAGERRKRSELSAAEQRARLRNELGKLLGDVAPAKVTDVQITKQAAADDQAMTVERIVLTGDDGGKIPLLLLKPARAKADRLPVVVALTQAGKAMLLKQRGGEIARLIDGGLAVCLPDVRNTGETGNGDRGRYSSATARAATALMVGDPLIAGQLRDVRTTLDYLRSRKDVDGKRIALWSQSLAQLNAADANFAVPRRIDGRPHDVEPLGGMLALLAALYEDDLAAVYVDRGLASFHGALASPYVYIPLDSVIPGLLEHADVADVAAALAPRPLRLAGMVDADNRRLSSDEVKHAFKLASDRFQRAKAADRLNIITEAGSPSAWLIEQLAGQ